MAWPSENTSGAGRFGLPHGCGNAGEGEGRCIFDEIDNLVEPTEGPAMDRVVLPEQAGHRPEADIGKSIAAA
jgi:hypothetical protein